MTVFELIADELARDQRLHEPLNSAHEGLSVIEEEVGELRREVYRKRRGRDPERLRKEAVRVAAMAARFLVDVIGIVPGRVLMDVQQRRIQARVGKPTTFELGGEMEIEVGDGGPEEVWKALLRLQTRIGMLEDWQGRSSEAAAERADLETQAEEVWPTLLRLQGLVGQLKGDSTLVDRHIVDIRARLDALEVWRARRNLGISDPDASHSGKDLSDTEKLGTFVDEVRTERVEPIRHEASVELAAAPEVEGRPCRRIQIYGDNLEPEEVGPVKRIVAMIQEGRLRVEDLGPISGPPGISGQPSLISEPMSVSETDADPSGADPDEDPRVVGYPPLTQPKAPGELGPVFVGGINLSQLKRGMMAASVLAQENEKRLRQHDTFFRGHNGRLECLEALLEEPEGGDVTAPLPVRIAQLEEGIKNLSGWLGEVYPDRTTTRPIFERLDALEERVDLPLDQVDEERLANLETIHGAKLDEIRESLNRLQTARDNLDERLKKLEKVLGGRSAEVLSSDLADVTALAVERKIEPIYGKLKILEEKVGEPLTLTADDLGERAAVIEAKIEELKASSERLEMARDRLDERLEKLEREVPAVDSRISNTSSDLTQLERQVRDIEGDVRDLEGKIR